MINSRKAGIGLAALFAVVVAAPVMADGVSDFQTHAAQAQQTLTQISQLVDSIMSHSGPTAGTPAPGGTVADTAETYKCPACGMAMTSTKTDHNTRAVTIKGKTWYCCAGCDMSKYSDKASGNPAGGKRTPRKKKNP